MRKLGTASSIFQISNRLKFRVVATLQRKELIFCWKKTKSLCVWLEWEEKAREQNWEIEFHFLEESEPESDFESESDSDVEFEFDSNSDVDFD